MTASASHRQAKELVSTNVTKIPRNLIPEHLNLPTNWACIYKIAHVWKLPFSDTFFWSKKSWTLLQSIVGHHGGRKCKNGLKWQVWVADVINYFVVMQHKVVFHTSYFYLSNNSCSQV